MSRKPHKVLGVLGGMGPAATADFLRILTEMAGVERDQDHPKVLLFSNPQIPDRTAAITGGGGDPAPLILEGLQRLESWGAQLLAVPCNTAHVFIDRFREKLKVPLVHIVEETLSRARIHSPSGAWLTATSGTTASGIYSREAERQGYELLLPGEDVQKELQEIVSLVKANRLDKSGRSMAETVRRLQRERDLPVVAACTELPLAYQASGLEPSGMVSSLGSLAEACLERIYSPS
ncbi:MAG TPA: amino acid racemase [Synergistales bacterium]|jgi:aspartate racemase|nr:amino acid racemase [Synergistales bacterium]MDI9393689.1 amino acid racemase [Synergistota bacterium]NLV65190.1 aspartate/glutamate racemase family protein [Synergistaceae bacterium]MDD4022877.1 amino acid racemase [Synergistales bacterium]MDD5514359.1 amino acid racemase [Synergistales bacterium]